jgi:hypothetical protein
MEGSRFRHETIEVAPTPSDKPDIALTFAFLGRGEAVGGGACWAGLLPLGEDSLVL